MKHSIVFVALFIVVLVVVAGSFLSPDDLKKCSQIPDPSITSCKKADAIVAISGGATATRTKEAVQLYKNGWADTLIFSGAALDAKSPSNARVMKKEAIKMGVPAEVIIVDEQSRTTRENAEQTRHKLDDAGIRRLILVTSPYHQRRASIEFQNANPSVTVVNHPVQHDPDWPQAWWVSPSSWYLAISEIVKIVIVSLGGGR